MLVEVPIYEEYKFYIRSFKSNIYCLKYKVITTHIAETICFLASQIVHHTLAGIEAGTTIVKRSTRAQVPKTYFIYCTFKKIQDQTSLKQIRIILQNITIIRNLIIFIYYIYLDNYRNDYGV